MIIKANNMPSQRQQRRQFNQFQQREERIWQPRIYALLRRQMNRTLAYVKANGVIQTITFLDMLVPNTEFKALLSDLYKKTGSKAANIQYTEIQGWEAQEGGKMGELPISHKLFGLNATWNRLLQAYIEIFGANKVVKIDETTKKWLRQKLEQSQVEGWDYYKLAQSMRTDGINFTRGKVIARTETVGATGLGRITAARQSKILMRKTWLNSKDKRVREMHKDAPAGVGGEQRDLEDKFSNGLTQPGDPAGTAKEVIQCRCTIIFEPVRNAQGRLIRI